MHKINVETLAGCKKRQYIASTELRSTTSSDGNQRKKLFTDLVKVSCSSLPFSERTPTPFKMLWPSLVVCLSTLWQASILYPVLASNVKPVDLAYSCIKISNNRGHYNNVPIILIHGMSGFKEMWKGMDEVMARETGREVCIVDLRNHGESPWSDEVDTATMTEDVKHLMDKLEIPKAIVLGHSLGGSVTMNLAIDYPERVDKMIIEDMRPNGLGPEGLQNVLSMLELLKDVENFVPQGVSEKEARKIFTKNYNDFLAKRNIPVSYDDPDMFPIRCTDGKCRWNANTLMFKKMLQDRDSVLIKISGRYDGPALFIYGTESHFKIFEDESNIKKLFPNAKLVGVKGAGHMVHEFPEFLIEVIKFINEKIRDEL